MDDRGFFRRDTGWLIGFPLAAAILAGFLHSCLGPQNLAGEPVKAPANLPPQGSSMKILAEADYAGVKAVVYEFVDAKSGKRFLLALGSKGGVSLVEAAPRPSLPEPK